MIYIFRNILNNKINNIVFVIINFIMLFSIILSGTLIREILQINNEVNRRADYGIEIRLNFKEQIKIEEMNDIARKLFKDNIFEFGKIGARINEKYVKIMCAENINNEILKVMTGRTFTKEEILGGENKAIIGRYYEPFVEKRNDKDYIQVLGTEYEVIGILGNKYGNSYYDDTVYVPFDSLPVNIKSSKEKSNIIFIDKNYDLNNLMMKSIKDMYSLESFDPIDSKNNSIYSNIDYYKKLVYKIIAIAIFIIINFYLVISMWIKQRNKQISIKKALGFDNKKILMEIFNEIILLSTVALVIATVFYKSYQAQLSSQIGANTELSAFAILFTFAILIVNCLLLTIVQLKNIDKCNLCEIMKE